VRLPRRLPASSEFLKLDGVYLIYDGGDDLELFIGQRAPPDTVQALLGTPQPPVDRAVLLSDRQNEHSAKLLAVARQLLGIKLPGAPVAVTLVGLGDPTDLKALAKLVEDKVYAEQSYHSFLAQLYSVVQQMPR
jgi:hypothetical protein